MALISKWKAAPSGANSEWTGVGQAFGAGDLLRRLAMRAKLVPEMRKAETRPTDDPPLAKIENRFWPFSILALSACVALIDWPFLPGSFCIGSSRFGSYHLISVSFGAFRVSSSNINAMLGPNSTSWQVHPELQRSPLACSTRHSAPAARGILSCSHSLTRSHARSPTGG